MSQTDARSFLERVAKNQEFRRNLMSELGTADGSPQQLIEAGSRHGLAFTESELAEALAERQTTSQVELGDTELEAVSGRYRRAHYSNGDGQNVQNDVNHEQHPKETARYRERYREQHQVSRPQVRH